MPAPRFATATDGVALSLRESGPADAPVVVCVHGYPDNSSVWDGIVAELAPRFRMIAYDVRGSGRSGAPSTRAGYRMAQLVADLDTVVDAVRPGGAVHVLAHDWGSIQAWHALADPTVSGRIASLTSISGPHLDLAGRWLRTQLRLDAGSLRAVVRQLYSSAYLPLFQLPAMPELLWRAGVLDALLARSARREPGGSAPAQRLRRDEINGLQLYRANLPRRPRTPLPAPTAVPVQVLAPTHDRFVTPALQTAAPLGFATDLRTRTVPGGHWVIAARPGLIAGLTAAFVDEVERRRAPSVS